MMFLAGIPGKLKTLLDRLTSTRAGYLDNLTNLDAAITSRAPASSALSTTQWTNARAGYLDNLSGGAPLSTVIASVQYCSTYMVGGGTSATQTIATVSKPKAVVIPLGVRGASTTPGDYHITLTLTNNTTVTLERDGTGGGMYANFVVVEFK